MTVNVVIEPNTEENGIKVQWSKPFKDFPKYITLDFDYYEMIMYDINKAGTEYVAFYSKLGLQDIAAVSNKINQFVPFGSLTKKSISDCECGAEKVNGPQTGHSHWCPKFRRP